MTIPIDKQKGISIFGTYDKAGVLIVTTNKKISFFSSKYVLPPPPPPIKSK